MSSGFIEEMDRYARFMGEFNEESHRGCAVLTMCVLEEALKKLFARRLPSKHFDQFYQRSGTERNVQRAEVLGLLSAREARCFIALAGIRNIFAHHALEKLSFDSPDIRERVSNLRPPLSASAMKHVRASTSREQFLMAASTLFAFMQMHLDNVQTLSGKQDVKIWGPDGEVPYAE